MLILSVKRIFLHYSIVFTVRLTKLIRLHVCLVAVCWLKGTQGHIDCPFALAFDEVQAGAFYMLYVHVATGLRYGPFVYRDAVNETEIGRCAFLKAGAI